MVKVILCGKGGEEAEENNWGGEAGIDWMTYLSALGRPGHSLAEYLLSTICVSDSFVSAGDSAVSKRDKISTFMEFTVSWGRQ